MKLKELKQIIDRYYQDTNVSRLDELDVVIIVKTGQIGPSGCSRLKSCSIGFDWNSGKFLLFPE